MAAQPGSFCQDCFARIVLPIWQQKMNPTKQ